MTDRIYEKTDMKAKRLNRLIRIGKRIVENCEVNNDIWMQIQKKDGSFLLRNHFYAILVFPRNDKRMWLERGYKFWKREVPKLKAKKNKLKKLKRKNRNHLSCVKRNAQFR